MTFVSLFVVNRFLELRKNKIWNSLSDQVNSIHVLNSKRYGVVKNGTEWSHFECQVEEIDTFLLRFRNIFKEILDCDKQHWIQLYHTTSLQALRDWILELEMSIHRNRFFGQTDRRKHRRCRSNSSLDISFG